MTAPRSLPKIPGKKSEESRSNQDKAVEVDGSRSNQDKAVEVDDSRSNQDKFGEKENKKVWNSNHSFNNFVEKYNKYFYFVISGLYYW